MHPCVEEVEDKGPVARALGQAVGARGGERAPVGPGIPAVTTTRKTAPPDTRPAVELLAVSWSPASQLLGTVQR